MEEEKGVKVVGVDIPFVDMVGFMIKWAFATIPAAIIIWVIVMFLGALLGAMLK